MLYPTDPKSDILIPKYTDLGFSQVHFEITYMGASDSEDALVVHTQPVELNF